MTALLPEAIFNYVVTVEEYVFALSEGKMPESFERARKIAQNYANDFFFLFMRFNNSFFIHALSWKNMCERPKT